MIELLKKPKWPILAYVFYMSFIVMFLQDYGNGFEHYQFWKRMLLLGAALPIGLYAIVCLVRKTTGFDRRLKQWGSKTSAAGKAVRYCRNCGKPIDADSKFCKHCGKPL